MPKCNECGAEIFIDSRFCPECGARVDFSAEKKSGEDVKAIAETGEKLAEELEEIEEIEKEAASALDDLPGIKKIDGAEKLIEKELEDIAPGGVTELPDIKAVEGIDIPAADTDEKFKVPDSVKKAVAQVNAVKETVRETAEKEIAQTAPPTPENKTKKRILPVFIYIAVLAVIIFGLAKVLNRQPAPPQVPIESTSVEITETAETSAETADGTAETTAETTAATAAETTVTTTETTVTTTVTSANETASESAESDESETEPAAPVLMRTTIEPADHVEAVGRETSCTVTLSEALITTDMLTDTSIFTAEYTSPSNAPMAPVSLLVIIDDDEVYVPASSFDDKKVVFGCDAVRAYVEDAGHSFDEINELAFISSGVPVDVSKVIIEEPVNDPQQTDNR
ncbi:MAG: zinc ribbon domain-containing protein [Oscillospiraceae bacterium]|nr:zinc ribbon domain-containing protein [Oscillospiraceae bacterium]